MKKLLLGLLSVVLVVLVSACGKDLNKIEKSDFSSVKPSAQTDIDKNKEQNLQKISREQAKEIVFSDANLQETDVRKLEIELDKENKNLVYDIEFEFGNIEYKYEIDAQNGNIIEKQIERD